MQIMIKKIAGLSLSLIMTIGLFAGCAKTPESDVKEPTANEEITPQSLCVSYFIPTPYILQNLKLLLIYQTFVLLFI